MKTIKTVLLAISFAFIMNSCEGPMGPPGQDGEALIGSIFEFEGDFLPSNNYKLYYTFPSNFKIYDTDVVLVYILWDVVNLNGKNTDVWRLIPQTLVYDQGILQYNFDYTIKDVSVFIETTMPFNQLLPAETQDQVFRIAVLPADFVASKKSGELNDLNFVLNAPELKMSIIK